jgi:lipoprotein-anchoring transpeptidase ErfK/SrfK
MIRHQPEAAKSARGIPGGLDNPPGAHTLHLYQHGAYALYTSSNPESIGTGI